VGGVRVGVGGGGSVGGEGWVRGGQIFFFQKNFFLDVFLLEEEDLFSQKKKIFLFRKKIFFSQKKIFLIQKKKKILFLWKKSSSSRSKKI